MLRGSVDLFNLFQSLAFERWKLLSWAVKATGKDKITNVKSKYSKKEFIKLRVTRRFYLTMFILSFSIIDYMSYVIQNINVRHTFKSIKNAYLRNS